MPAVTPAREAQLSPNSFEMCRYNTLARNPFPFHTYKITSHLHIPNALKPAHFQAPAKISYLTHFLCSDTTGPLSPITHHAPPKGSTMSQPDISQLNRCHYRDSAGRRCRLPRKKSHPTFCLRHARPDELEAGFGAPGKGAVPVGFGAPGKGAVPVGNDLPIDLSGELLGPLQDFRSATSVNFVLGRLLLLKAAGVVSARDAAVVTYICQLLIQTVPAVRKEMDWSRRDDPQNAHLRSVINATRSVWGSPETASAAPTEATGAAAAAASPAHSAAHKPAVASRN